MKPEDIQPLVEPRQAGELLGIEMGEQLLRKGCSTTFIATWLEGFVRGINARCERGAREALSSGTSTARNGAVADVPPLHTARILESRVYRESDGISCRTIKLDIEGMILRYRPGDELGVFPTNTPETVRDVLRALGLNPQTRIRSQGASTPVWQVLLERVNLQCASERFYEMLAGCASSQDERKAVLALSRVPDAKYRSVISLFRRFPRIRPTTEEVLESLDLLTPSLIPISGAEGSTRRLEVLAYDACAQSYGGLDPSSLRRCDECHWLTFTIRRNDSTACGFDRSAPVVFVSDALGAAVVRAQLAQREALGHHGRNWIVGFGAWGAQGPYAEDAQAWLRTGFCRAVDSLSADPVAEFDVKFAQLEEALWRWIVDGAVIYVAVSSGSLAERFYAHLRRLIAIRGRLGDEASASRLHAMREEGSLVRWIHG